ncbi:hypothetical protein CPC08DRAFT_637894, partial [Agrocybe pediades]
FRLDQAGIAVTDQDKILALTMGLPPSYDAVIINFDSTPSDQLTLNHVISRLLNEEVRQLGNKKSKTDDKGWQTDEAMAASETGKGRRVATDVTCFFCDKKGHYKSECSEKQEWEKKKKENETAANAEEYDSESEGVW